MSHWDHLSSPEFAARQRYFEMLGRVAFWRFRDHWTGRRLDEQAPAVPRHARIDVAERLYLRRSRPLRLVLCLRVVD